MNKNEVNQDKGITNMVSKEDSNNKIKSFIESAAVIIGVMAFALVVVFLCQKTMASGSNTKSEVTIGTNSAEDNFYDADYKTAISEYESMQDKEEWPIYKAKEAEVYSVKGEYSVSNRLLADCYDIRNNLIRKNGIESYEGRDEELGNLIVFTALMNGDIEKALEYGEIFFLDDGNSKELDKTMFTVYLANDKKDEAESILDNIDYDEDSAYDLAEIAYMKMILGKYDEGIQYLNEAYDLDKDEPKIYDVLEDIMIYHKDSLLRELKDLHKNNSDKLSYAVFLAKCYSLNKSTVKNGQQLLDEIKNRELGETVFKTIEADIYKNSGDIDKYNTIIEEITNDENRDYYKNYIAAKYAYENKDYVKGIENAKYSIIDNRDYPNTYGVIMPELLCASKESDKAESYFRTALYKEPFNYNIILKLADYCRDVQQDADKALKYYTLASKIYSDNAEIYYNMGVAKLTLNKKDEGISLLEKAIKLDSKEPKYYRRLAYVYLENKENDKAIKEIRKAYAVNEEDIKTLNAAGYYYMSVNEIDRAVTNFKSAYEGINDSTDLNVKNIITKNYEKAKQYSDNKNSWTKSSIEDFKLVD